MDIPGLLRRVGPGKSLGLLLALFAVVVLLLGADFAATGGDPVSAIAAARLFRIAQGEPLNVIADRLQSAGVIRSSLYFRLTAELTGQAKDVQAGTYLLSGGDTAQAILTKFVEGQVAVRKLTIPEGFTVSDIAMRLQSEGIVSVKSFIAVATTFANPFLPSWAKVRYRLEGYAFPSTYELPYGATPMQVADTLFAQWERQFTPAMRQLAHSERLTTNEVLTIASMVEKEAKVPGERPKIAAVFLNRLKLHMPMQSDPTVGYAMRRHLTAVTLKDERFSSPYNTYYVRGLPPGPICNPGLPSILAVLHPAKVPYLYFYGLPNGTHIFSRTYAEQLAAERAYP